VISGIASLISSKVIIYLDIYHQLVSPVYKIGEGNALVYFYFYYTTRYAMYEQMPEADKNPCKYHLNNLDFTRES